ncbi:MULTISPECIES: glucose-1-phosphate cytidylyltransferase [Rhodophyticola]|uniref:glucose-1-phosphate cytidylyltransferase n=1 Tax=Rhodophyticola TaxID=2680018 RepID=UPI0035CFF52A
MKAIILAGGFGTRISEESHLRPKPMIEIGGRPILWHIMKIYVQHGITDFIICCGYKGFMIKEYFANYFLHMSDVTFHMLENRMEVHQAKTEPWSVTVVDTGEDTMTGGRLKRVADYIDGTFCLTYGDGLSNIDIKELIAAHRRAGTEATVTAVQPLGRYGALEIKDDRVSKFLEKPVGDGQWINGGYFVCEPSVLDRIDGPETPWEGAPLEGLAQDRQLSVYKHNGFWAAMDTLRDKRQLETLWEAGDAPWRIWD